MRTKLKLLKEEIEYLRDRCFSSSQCIHYRDEYNPTISDRVSRIQRELEMLFDYLDVETYHTDCHEIVRKKKVKS